MCEWGIEANMDEEKTELNLLANCDTDNARTLLSHIAGVVRHQQKKSENPQFTSIAEKPGDPDIMSKVIKEPKSKRRRTASCPICQKYFSKLHGVKRHIIQTHANLVQISCNLCSKKIGFGKGIYQHFQEEHNNLIPKGKRKQAPGYLSCPVCSSTLQSQALIKEHLVNSHADLIHVSCTLCQREVMSMLEYYQHFIRYHSHVTQDKNLEEVATDYKAAFMEKLQMGFKKVNNGIAPSSVNPDLVCLRCDRCLETKDLLDLHMLSHRVDENTDSFCHISDVQKTLVHNSSVCRKITNSDDLIGWSTSNPKPGPSKQCPLPELSNVSVVLGPDLIAAINRSINVMTELCTKLGAELKGDVDKVYKMFTKEDLVRKLNKVLQFSSGITDVGKCLLLVLEESQQFNGNPCVDNDGSVNKFDVQVNFDADPVFVKTEPVDPPECDYDSGNNDTNSESESDETLCVTFASNNCGVELVNPDDAGGSDNSDVMIKKELVEGGNGNDTTGAEIQSKSKVAAGLNRYPSLRFESNTKKCKETHVCNICGRQCSTRSRLVSHVAVHSKMRPFKCVKCPASFKLDKHLKKHVKIHLKDDQFKCDFCDFSNRTLSLVKKHSVEEHEEAPLLPCDLCEHKVKSTYDLTVHKRDHEPRSCELCEFEAGDLADLQAHENIVHANKHCSHCSFSCVSDKQLQRHLRAHENSWS